MSYMSHIMVNKMVLKEEYVKVLKEIVGPKRISTEYVDRVFYSKDLGMDPTELPGAVLLPKTVDEIVKIVTFANKNKIPIYVMGRGSGLFGFGVKEDSIVLVLSGMNKILNIDKKHLTVTTETGAVWLAVNSTLWKQGYELTAQWHGGVISSTLGGAVTANTVARTSEDGTAFGETVVSLEVVLPNGQVIRTGSAANPKSIPFERYTLGPDLTGLFIGSEGTFGIITKVSLKIRRKRDVTDYLSFAFRDYRDAVDAIVELQHQNLMQFGILIQGAILEKDIICKLHIVLTGDANNIEYKKKLAEAICRSYHGERSSAEHAKNFWETYYYSWLRGYPTKQYYVRSGIPYFCPEVNGYFPFEQLPKIFDAVWEEWNTNPDIKKYKGLFKAMDTFITRNGGFVWFDPLFPKLDPDAVKFGLQFRNKMLELFMELGGCPAAMSSATSPVILSKIGPTYEFMKLLKKAIDPNNILNPGVLFPEEL